MTTFTAFFQLDSWSTLFILMLDNVINVSFALAAAALVLVLFRPLNRVKVGHATKLQLNLLHVLTYLNICVHRLLKVFFSSGF